MLIGNRGWVLPRIFRTATVGNISRSYPSPVRLPFPIFCIEPGQGKFSPVLHRPVFALTLAVSQIRSLRGISSRNC